jgi:hypothetical protein
MNLGTPHPNRDGDSCFTPELEFYDIRVVARPSTSFHDLPDRKFCFFGMCA